MFVNICILHTVCHFKRPPNSLHSSHTTQITLPSSSKQHKPNPSSTSHNNSSTMDLNACGSRSHAMQPHTSASGLGASSTEPHTGTTIVACTFKGGVVLGADGRVSTGNYVSNRASNKITRLTDNVYLLRSGSAADTQAVGDYGASWHLFCASPCLVLAAPNKQATHSVAYTQQLCAEGGCLCPVAVSKVACMTS